MPLEEGVHLGNVLTDPCLRHDQIIAGRDHSERPEREVGGDVPLSYPLHFDIPIRGATAREPDADEETPQRHADGENC